MDHTFKVLSVYGSDAARWQSFWDRLPYHVRDVMFTPAYYRVQAFALNATPPVTYEDQGSGYDPKASGYELQGRASKPQQYHRGSSAHCAIYCWQDFFIMQPFLLRPIPDSIYNDITSPHGFGGPVSNIDGLRAGEIWSRFEAKFSEWRKSFRVISEYCALSPTAADHQVKILSNLDVPITQTKEVVLINVDQTDDAILAQALKSKRDAYHRGCKAGLKVGTQLSTYDFDVIYRKAMDSKGANSRWKRRGGYFGNYTSQHIIPYYGTIIGVDRRYTLAQAAIVLFGGRTAHYHYAARTDDNAVGAGEVLMMAACRAARAAGAQWLNIGGGINNKRDDGLWNYKRRWSPHRAPVLTYRRIFYTDAYQTLCSDAGVDDYHSWFPAYRAKDAA